MIDDAPSRLPHQGPAQVPAQGPAHPSADAPIPAPRVVSDDELLGAETQLPEPFLRLQAVRESRRLRKAALVALAAAAVAVVGFASGAATHGADVHKAADTARQRVLLRLVGGGPTLITGQAHSQAARAPGPLITQLEVVVRNDGAQPTTVASVDLREPGTTVTSPAASTVIQPSQATILAMTLQVDCAAPDLIDRPDAVTLHVQNPGAPATTVTLPFMAPEKAAPEKSALMFPARVGSFYLLCGFATLTERPATGYVGMSGTATAADPAFGFKVAVHNDGDRPLALAPAQLFAVLPGTSITADIPKPVPLPARGAAEVRVGIRITDCAKVGKILKFESGVSSYLGQVENDLPFGAESADPRFQQLSPGTLPLTANVSAFEHDLLVNLAAACPALK